MSRLFVILILFSCSSNNPQKIQEDNIFRSWEFMLKKRNLVTVGRLEDQKDYPFSVFGLKKSSSEEDMKKAYHKAVRETHPDKTGEDTEDEFRQVQEAYEYYQNYII